MADNWERYAASLQKINEGPVTRQKRQDQAQQAMAKAASDAEQAKRQADAEHAFVRTDLTASRQVVSGYLGRAGLPHALPTQRPANVPTAGQADLAEAVAKTRDSVLRVKPAYEAYMHAAEQARNPVTQRSKLPKPLLIGLYVVAAYVALNILTILF